MQAQGEDDGFSLFVQAVETRVAFVFSVKSGNPKNETPSPKLRTLS